MTQLQSLPDHLLHLFIVLC